jgi:hypothetical protein
VEFYEEHWCEIAAQRSLPATQDRLLGPLNAKPIRQRVDADRGDADRFARRMFRIGSHEVSVGYHADG